MRGVIGLEIIYVSSAHLPDAFASWARLSTSIRGLLTISGGTDGGERRYHYGSISFIYPTARLFGFEVKCFAATGKMVDGVAFVVISRFIPRNLVLTIALRREPVDPTRPI